MDNKELAEITKIVKSKEEEIKKILSSKEMDITQKVVLLRKMGREIADIFVGTMRYKSVEEFTASYDKGDAPLIKLEGEGIRHDDVIILKDCPMAPLFDDFKEKNEFPEYWKRLPEEYMEKFKKEALLHPLCIVHQTFRDILTSRIPKGKSHVHSTTVACRSMSTGKVVYSKFGMQLAEISEEEINALIDGFACAFLIK